MSRNPSPRVPGPRGGPCVGSPCGSPGVHTRRVKGDGLPAVGPHGARGPSSGVTGDPAQGVTGDPAWCRHSLAPAGRGAALQPLRSAKVSTCREHRHVPGLDAPSLPGGESLGEGAAGCLESDVGDSTACARVPGGKAGRVGSRQRRQSRLLSTLQMCLSCMGTGDLPGHGPASQVAAGHRHTPCVTT